MSVLTHRCRGCGHLEDRHAARERGYQSCRCCNDGSPDLDPEPLLLETYAVPGHRREPLWPPGSARNAGTSHVTRACGCGPCRTRAATFAAPGGGNDSVPALRTGKMGSTTVHP